MTIELGGARARGKQTEEYSNHDPDFGPLGPSRLPERASTEAHAVIHHTVNSAGDLVTHLRPHVLDTSRFEGAILDLDGFILNSERPIVRAIMLGAQDMLREAAGNNAARLPLSLIRRITGEALGNADTKMSLIVRSILSENGAIPERCRAMSDNSFIEEFKGIRRNHFRTLIDSGEFAPLVGAVEFVKELSRKFKGRVSIYTGSPKENADLEITAVGLDGYLPRDFRVYASDLPPGKGKPEPDGFHLAKEKLGIKSFVSAGDRKNDFIAAMGAGGCGEFIAVAEDLNNSPFQKALMDARLGKLTLSPGAVRQIERDSHLLLDRLVLLRSLEPKSIEIR